MQIVGRGVDQVARERRRQREALAPARPVAGFAGSAGVRLDDAQLADRPLRLLLLVAVEVVGAEDRALDDRLGPLARGHSIAEHLGSDCPSAEIPRPAHSGRRRPAQHFRGRLGAGTEPGDDDPPVIGVRVRDLARLPRELFEIQHPLELPLGRAVDAR